MFQVIGDEIRFDDWSVGRLRTDIPATVRGRCVAALDGTQYVERDELEDVQRELAAAEEHAGDLERERDDARQAKETAEGRLEDIEEILDDPVPPEAQLARIRAIIEAEQA